MLRFEDALARLLALATPTLVTEDVAIEDADGRILGAAVLSRPQS